MSAYATDEGHVFVVCCISCKKYTVSSCPLVPTYITFFHSVVPESRTKFRSPDTDDFSNDIWDGKFRMRFYILNKLPFVLVMAAAHWQPCRVPQFLGKKVLSFTIFLRSFILLLLLICLFWTRPTANLICLFKQTVRL